MQDVHQERLLAEQDHSSTECITSAGFIRQPPMGCIKIASDVVTQLQNIGNTQELGSDAEVISFLIQQYQKICSSQPIIDWCAKCGSKELTFTCVACEHSWSSFAKSKDTSKRRQVEEHCGHDTVIFVSPNTAEKHNSFVPDCQMYPKTDSSVSKQGADTSAQSLNWVAVSGEKLSTTSGKVNKQVKDSTDSLGHKSYFKMTTMPAETPTDKHSIVSAANYSFNDRSDMSGDDAADGSITALPETQLNVATSVPRNPYLINSIMTSPAHPNLSQIGLSLLSTQMVLENLAVSTACRLIHNEGNISEREAENMLPLPVVVKGEKENSRTSAQIGGLHENSNKHPENVQSLHQEQHKEKDSRISCRLQVMRQPRTVNQSQKQAETSPKVQRPFLCEICGFANLTKVAFQRHLMTHTGEKPFLCQQCGDSFKDAWGLKKHVSKIHSRNKLYKCRICTDVFLSPRCLHLHLETVHSDRKTYRCQVCGKALATAKSLRRHKRIHTGEKPYECPHCDRAFNNSSGRVAHMKLHQDPNSVLYIPSVTNPS